MRYFYDLEFVEDGRTIDLISIGIVAEDGREYYAVDRSIESGETYAKIRRHQWLMENVVPHLPIYKDLYRPIPPDSMYGRFELDLTHSDVRATSTIAKEVAAFLLDTDQPIELWAYYGAYDHVCLMQLWGSMIDKPEGIPMFTHDIMQLCAHLNISPLAIPSQVTGHHHALADARYVKFMYEYLSHEPPF